ncbi:O-succinylbenzoic acid--CoA ligase [Prevotella herbatica]|uniref:O-succinylbenzoic acid--CoA ligase n=1 Tax=Prevotella herbatica TaxID=2801997 RepID=A0ABM7P1U6_9BACT|nr:AMP-binding protein [Prevotella herbatica]BCS86732.1 O-succinylbenzoic acid--CoA ligase [Prevotella herbatica]
MTLDEFLTEWNNESDMILVHTSGSTGNPKPMYVEKKRMLNSARITCDFLGLCSGDTAFLCMPLDYIAGKMMVVRSIERKLNLVSVSPSGHPLKDISLSFDKPSLAAMVPLQVYNSLNVAAEAEKLRSFTHLIIGGGAIDDELAKVLRSFPNHVWSTYGMTETLSHIALRRLNGDGASEWYTPFDSVDVSQNEDGCLVIDAPLVHEGKLVTNDIVELKDGKFRILGRKDNVICSGGIKIQMEEVERVLRPYMESNFMITKRSDKKFGEIVVLITENDNIAEVEAICKRVLPKYWCPHDYLYVERIPLTETGKPARAKALSLAEEV